MLVLCAAATDWIGRIHIVHLIGGLRSSCYYCDAIGFVDGLVQIDALPLVIVKEGHGGLMGRR